nr:MAG TPA: hypothetical protein [Caudoviricetes sp.]
MRSQFRLRNSSLPQESIEITRECLFYAILYWHDDHLFASILYN